MNNTTDEKLRFQAEPSTDLSDELYELGQRAKKHYKEPVFGEFLIQQALFYRTGEFQMNYEDMMEYYEQINPQEGTEESEEKALKEIFAQIPPDKIN